MENNTAPLITILTPAYNAERFICRCLDSLTAQTYPHIEIIVVDDCSTDA
ncbi:MAG: glycosyltransferase, partial [Prevotella sp.]|nr:glycosyltransferase [Prevotella sp.]